MKRYACLFAGLLALSIATPVLAQQHQHPDTRAEAEAAIREVVEGFSGALQRGDSTAALEFLHPDVVIYEAGHAETLDQYRNGHLASDMAFADAVTQQTTSGQITVGHDIALYLSEYTSAGTFREREIDSHGTETMVLVRTVDGWRIRHIHWSSR